MKLLIVEDNLLVRRTLRTVVEKLADQIEECGNGRDAVRLYRNLQPDFVLMDIDLGEMNGIAATREITSADPDAKVVIVTNYDEPDLRDEAAKAGASGYVLKENLFEVLDVLSAYDRAVR